MGVEEELVEWEPTETEAEEEGEEKRKRRCRWIWQDICHSWGAATAATAPCVTEERAAEEDQEAIKKEGVRHVAVVLTRSKPQTRRRTS